MTKVVGVRLDEKMLKRLENYKEAVGFRTDTEALIRLIDTGLTIFEKNQNIETNEPVKSEDNDDWTVLDILMPGHRRHRLTKKSEDVKNSV